MLALIAGEGALPVVLADRLDRAGYAFHLCELEGHVSRVSQGREVHRFRLETLGGFIQDLRASGVDKLCLAGHVARPGLDPALVDEATTRLLPDILSALQDGDDSALGFVIELFEDAGLRVIGASQIAPDLLPDPGVHSQQQPLKQDHRDVERGMDILAALGEVDVGQACVVSGGQALAVETFGGTDRMLRSLAVEPMMPEGGLLMKACKPGQDRRVDMPTIGPDTFTLAAQMGLRGIVIEAGGVLVLDLPRCVALAQELGLLFWVRE